MKITVEIPDYEEDGGLDVIWEKNAHYKLYVSHDSVCVSANAEGLMSLAKQMIYLAVNDVPEGSHIHFDPFFTKIQDMPVELVIHKNLNSLGTR